MWKVWCEGGAGQVSRQVWCGVGHEEMVPCALGVQPHREKAATRHMRVVAQAEGVTKKYAEQNKRVCRRGRQTAHRKVYSVQCQALWSMVWACSPGAEVTPVAQKNGSGAPAVMRVHCAVRRAGSVQTYARWSVAQQYGRATEQNAGRHSTRNRRPGGSACVWCRAGV